MTETPEIARAYLAAFLREPRADELAREAVDEAGPDADRSSLVGIAHRRLTAEVRVTDDVAADVLVRELGLTAEEAAGVLGVATDQVVASVDEATSVEQELAQGIAPSRTPTVPETPEAATPPADRSPPVRYVFDAEAPPEEGTAPGSTDDVATERAVNRQVVTVVVGILVAVAVGVAIAMSIIGSAGGDPAGGADVAGEVTITDSRTTDQMGDDGPGPARVVFTPGDPVIFWFSYEPVSGRADVELALLREEEELISPDFPLPQGRTDSHVTLPNVVTEDPGAYRIELRRDGRVLVQTEFRIEAE